MSNDLRARAKAVLDDRSDWTWARQGTARAVVRDLLAALDDARRLGLDACLRADIANDCGVRSAKVTEAIAEIRTALKEPTP